METVRSVPALATGAVFALARTVTPMLSLPVAPWLSVTVSSKPSVVSTLGLGAIKLAVALSALVMTTVGPAV